MKFSKTEISLTSNENGDVQIKDVEITHFRDDVPTIKGEKPMISVDTTSMSSAQETRTHDLKDFLKRPILIASLPVDGTQNPDHIVSTTVFPTEIWNHQMWTTKLKGFRFFRCTLNFRFILNGSPFDYGRWWAFFSPFEAEAGFRQVPLRRGVYTAYPGVEIDLGTGTVSELEIPYVSPFSHLDQLLSTSPFGNLSIRTVNSLQSTTGNTAEIMVYLWLSDIDLSIPTDTASLPLNVPFGQVRSRKYNPEQERASKQGIVSGVAGGVKQVADALSNVPVVGPIAKVASWVSGAVEGVASYFGFSKPSTIQTVTKILNVPMEGYTQSENVDYGTVVGTKQSNALTHFPEVFGTSVDEMDIAYVCSKSCLMSIHTWGTGLASGAAITSRTVHPGLTPNDATYDDGRYGTTPMNYVTTMHRFWKGSITFRFSICKNAFYSGRLMIVYGPGLTITQIGTADYNQLPKWIWDIRESNDLEITFPKAINSQWLRTRLTRAGFDDNTADTTFILGSFRIIVLTPLRAPPTVHNDVKINIWMKGGPDLQFATPDFNRFKPVYGPVGLEKKISCRKVEEPHVQLIKMPKGQVFSRAEPSFKHTDQILSGQLSPDGPQMLESQNDISIYPFESCIGEVTTNLRELTRRFGTVYMFDSFTEKYNRGFQHRRLTLDPALFWNSNVAGDQSTLSYTPIGYISAMYRFYRGSRRYKLFCIKKSHSDTETNAADYIHRMTVTSQQLSSMSPINFTAGLVETQLPGAFQHTTFVDVNPVLECTVPYYSNVPMQVISNDWVVRQHSRMVYSFEYFPPFEETANWTQPEIGVMTAAGDDFSFGYLLGTPMVDDTEYVPPLQSGRPRSTLEAV